MVKERYGDVVQKGGTVMKGVQTKHFSASLTMVLFLFVGTIMLGSLQSCQYGGSEAVEKVPRVSVEKARQNTLSGESLFVCAYEDFESCNKIRLDRGMLLKEFESMLSDVSKEKEIIFYCT